MLFNSVQFLIFFPLVTLLYFVIPQRVRYLWLLAASYYFYMCWNAKYALLIATSTLITYASGLLIQKAGDRQGLRKLWVGLSFGSNLAILFFFKYFDFALDALNRVLAVAGMQLNAPAFDILLPVGISFYTFQALSYTMDVYRGEIEPERNVLKYALFVSFFPQLVAGPIERSKNLLEQVSHEVHTFDYDRAKSGLLLMLWGLFEKIVIADRAAIFVNEVFDHYGAYAFVEIALAVVLFAVQIYCDFGGYSHMAIGAAQVMGFRLMDNFRQPYFAVSIQDFWRRWHISLSTWFRDYLYIPLGGNRKGKVRRYINVMITFLASGLWHGASWNYVVWGGLHGFYQVAGNLLKPLREKLIRTFRIHTDCFSWQLLRRACTFVLVCFAWIFFRAPGCAAALQIIRQMFSECNLWMLMDSRLYEIGLGRPDFRVLTVAVLTLLAVDLIHEKGISLREKLAQQNAGFRWLVYFFAIMAVMIFGIYGPMYGAGQFIYFQF